MLVFVVFDQYPIFLTYVNKNKQLATYTVSDFGFVLVDGGAGIKL